MDQKSVLTLTGGMANPKQKPAMTAAQKASALVALRIANNVLIEVLTSSGPAQNRPQEATDAVHAAIELLENARRAFESAQVAS